MKDLKKPDKKNLEDVLALTPLQEGMLFHYLQNPTANLYVEQLILEISGEIDAIIFEKALNLVIETNPMLRTVFRWEKMKHPLQVVLKRFHLKPIYHDLSSINTGKKNKLAEEIKINDRKKTFDLQEVPFRVTVCKIETGRYQMIVTNHHILYDGWSNGIILKEFFNAYHDFAQNRTPAKPIKNKFKEYIRWIKNQDKNKQEKFWREYLRGVENPTELAIKMKKARSTLNERESAEELRITGKYQTRLSRDNANTIEEFVKKHRITLAALLYSSWGILLQKYNDSRDVLFGTTVSGRTAKLDGIEDMVGLFINTLPLRVKRNPHEIVIDMLNQVNHTLQNREEYETTSLVDIDAYSQTGNAGELFDSIMVIENYPLARHLMTRHSQLSIDSYSMVENTNYDLTVGIVISDDIELDFVYKQEYFEPGLIKNLSGHFCRILENIIKNPTQQVHELEILSEEEKQQLLVDFNDTAMDYPREKTIHRQFAEQAEQTPDYLAVAGPAQIKYRTYMTYMTYISYRELNEKSNHLAEVLLEKGIKPDTIVGIMIERSVEMIIGILGILKAGGAYLPIDPEYPEERIDYILTDSNTKFLVTTTALSGKFKKLSIVDCQLLMVNEEPSGYPGFNNPPKEAHPINNYQLTINNLQLEWTNLAYLIYTSGTTGKPKGVMAEHRNVIAYINAFYNEFKIALNDIFLQQASFSFDAFAEEVYPILLRGGKLVVCPKDVVMNPDHFFQFLIKQHITMISCTPLLMAKINNRDNLTTLDSIHTFISGGDVLKKEYVDNLLKIGNVYNTYGPTETTVCAAYYQCLPTDTRDVPIGKPISNYNIYIVDKDNHLLPQGAPGELCIGGAGVARGYLNQPQLTAEKFCPHQPGGSFCKNRPLDPHKNFPLHPLHPLHTSHKSYMSYIYRTGDLARWLPDGNIEFLGRIDHQVKIRGFRIELGEIENRLLNHPLIKEAVVIPRVETSKRDDKKLCAYVVKTGTKTFDQTPANRELRGYLAHTLPDYMIPSYFVTLDKLPLTSTGKIDRKALPEPGIKSEMKYIPPRNDGEKLLVELWADVLEIGKEKIGIDDHFFELGGHSLTAIGLIARINQVFDIEITISQLFKNPTIRGIYRCIKKAAPGVHQTLNPAEKKEYYPLSPSQKRLHFLQQMDPGSTTYNMHSAMIIAGDVGKDKLQDTFRKLIRRHESLRTSFEIPDDQPVQRIHDQVAFACECFEGTRGLAPLSIAAAHSPQPAADIIGSFIRPFDLSRAPLLRVRLMKLPNTPLAPPGHHSHERQEHKYILMVDMHHIISDGVSTSILIKEFAAAYSNARLPGLRLQYKDYTEWQDKEKDSESMKQQEKYWLNQFAIQEEIPALNLPIDYPRPKVQGFEGETLHFEIGIPETTALKSLALKEEATLFIVLLAIYNIFLSKLTNQQDITVGIPVAARRHNDLRNIIGMFVNTLVMRNFPCPAQSFSEFLKEVKEKTLNAFENQEYPFEALVEKPGIDRDTSRNPLFDVMFVLQNMETADLEIPGLTLKPYEYENLTSKFDMTLIGEEKNQKLFFSMEYCTKLFKQKTILRFITYFKNIVSSIIDDCERKISAIPFIPEEEKQRVLHEFNDTFAEYPQDKTLHELFKERAERNPDHTAVVGMSGLAPLSGLMSITYKELNENADRSAYSLIGKGVGPDAIVGIMIERSIDMIIGILGILKAGGAYLPIDPEYPEQRVQYILKDSSAQVLVVGDTPCASWLSFAPKVLLNLSEGHHLNFPASLPSDLAYLIYTSGSTGKPKGVMVAHTSAVNVLSAMQKEYPLEKTDAYLLKTSVVFDVSVTELFGWFFGAGRLVILGKNGEKDPDEILETIERMGITHINFVPSMFNTFVEVLDHRKMNKLSGLRYIFLAGEALLPGMVDKFRRMNSGIQLENIYGPTEGTVYSSKYPLSHWKGNTVIPIGQPIQNTRLYILDKDNRLQPIGVPGELCISGIGVARGYLNQPELTSGKFIDKALSSLLLALRRRKRTKSSSKWSNQTGASREIPGARSRELRAKLYKTGDQARWLPDGNVEFLGRIDHQVKIRGYRIELGEIETRLLKKLEIKETVVVTKEMKPGEKLLCAYIVSDKELDTHDLRDFLSGSLPDYMIPAYFIRLDTIPLTPNGKVDRKALPKPGKGEESIYAAPGNQIQEKLVGIWSQVLGIEDRHIGIDSNFFRIGGHSLNGAVVIAKIHKVFNVKLPLVELFNFSTIRGLSKIISQAAKDKYLTIEPMEKREYYNLSSAQMRLFILHQVEPNNINYNISQLLVLESTGESNIDISRLERTFNRLVQRHESLRTSFEIIDDQPVQRIHDQVAFACECFEGTRGLAPLSIPAAHSQQPAADIISSFIRPFDLSRAPLLRVGLMELPHHPDVPCSHPSQKGRKPKYLLMVDMHHIIADGVSMGIIIEDFISLYANTHLPGLRLRYRDYSKWQDKTGDSNWIKQQEEYWLKQFDREIPVLNLPIDYPRPAKQSFSGNDLHFEIAEKDTRALKSLALKEEVTLFMLLLSFYYVLLSNLCQQEDIIVGTPIATRRHEDLRQIIGMFVNTLALRNFPLPGKSFTGFLEEVKNQTLNAYENREYPFETLVEKVIADRDPGRNPLFDAMFALQNMEIADLEIPGLKLKPFEYENRTSKFDMALIGEERNQKLFFSIEYSTKLFKPGTILRFITYFKNIVSSIIEDSERKISAISFMPEEEKRRVLHEFNDTFAEYPRDKTLHELFKERVEKSPHHLAVVGMSGLAPLPGLMSITYKELDEKSGQLAHLLIREDVKPDTIVGIMTERSIEMIIGIFGILKAGGAYLPIDPDYPGERIKYMTADSNTKFLVTTTGLSGKFKKLLIDNCQLSIVDSQLNSPLERGAPKGRGVSEPAARGSQLAYIIYTSGSTGKPKGTMAQHRSLVNACHWQAGYYNITGRDHAAQYASFVFDASVLEIFPCLIQGASLYIIPGEIRPDLSRLNRYYEKIGITIGFLPTQAAECFMELENRSLRVLIAAGDKLRVFIKQNYQVYNNYGPTENTVAAAAFLVDRQYPNIPIGKPIQNNYFYILSPDHFQLLPIGIAGELCISGDSLTRGYLNNPGLTAEKFDRDKKKKLPGKRITLYSSHYPITPLPHYPIYRTGDLARWLEDGNIEFLGRKDHQVKIRGFRIELGEIENRLLKHQNVKEALVISREENRKNKCLCAYIVPQHMAAFRETGLREYLAAELPDYLVPTYFVPLEKMPLNPNGKTDRKALPEPAVTKGDRYVPPGNRIQKKLVKIWTGVLGRKSPMGIDDDFFKLGGHSLTAAIIAANIHRELDVKVPLAEIFNNSTIKRLAAYISKSKNTIYEGIRPVEKRDYYPQSSAQKRLFLLDKLEAIRTGYNIPVALKVEGKPGKESIENAFKTMIERHESLRTSFHLIGSESIQRIHHQVEFKIEYDRSLANCQGRGEVPSPIKVQEIIKNFIRPFDLSRAPLLRVGIMELPHTPAPFHGILIIDMHHIVSDATSMSALVKEFISLYEGKALSPLNIQYKDFSCWQNQLLKAGQLEAQEEYWLKLFKETEGIPVLNLTGDYKRPTVQSFEGNALKFEIEEEVAGRLKTMALKDDVTLYILLLAIYNIFLSKLSNQEDIIVGTPTASRRHADLQPIIGMFVNTLALRNKPSGEKTFNTFLKEVKEKTLAAFENQEYPLEELVEKVAAARDAGRNPLFDVMFALQNVDFPELQIPGLKLTLFEPGNNISKFDLTLQVIESKTKLVLTFEYCTKLFRKETIDGFIKYFKKIVTSVIADPGQEIARVEILPLEEKQRILYEFNDTALEYPRQKSIHRLFTEQVEHTPDYIALVGPQESRFEGTRGLAPLSVPGSITYHELNKKANQLASILKEKGVKPDTIVGLMVERSLKMIIGMLGILKAGGAYLPIDPQYPQERINYMINDSSTKFLVTTPGLSKKFKKLLIVNCQLLMVNEETPDGSGFNNPPKEAASHLHLPPAPATSLAYLIYTSGSTGKPKGVLIKHRNVVRLVTKSNYIDYLDFKPGDRFLLTGNFVFDITTFEIWTMLLKGIELYIVNKDAITDAEKLRELVAKTRITHLHLIPQLFNQHVFNCPGIFKTLKCFLVGGDMVNPGAVAQLRSKYPQLKILHMYGPTENTTFSTFFPVEKDYRHSIPIGKPISNSTVYILNSYNHLQPTGVFGELCTGGDGTARGYLNNPELTAEKFFTFSNESYKSYRSYISRTLYRTGDLARWLQDGNIEFSGRIDHQIKIRGFRIELGEIENQLMTHPQIKETVVVSREDENNEKYLCAYFVSNHTLTTSKLREYLAKNLPDYMIPSYFIRMEQIPLSPNGKIDRNLLPAPGLPTGENHAAPGDEIEKQLVKIWAQILSRDASHASQLQESIGVHDNFFESGGHSLKAIILLSRVHKQFNVKISLGDFFAKPTIAGLSTYIKASIKHRYSPIASAEEKEYYELSSAQRRLYILHQMEPGITSYHITGAFELEGLPDMAKLEETFRQLIQRHESFRTSIQLVNETPVQRIHDQVAFEIEYDDMKEVIEKGRVEGWKGRRVEEKEAPIEQDLNARGSHNPKSQELRAKSCISSFIRPFDLSRAPLLRVGLMELPHTPAALPDHPRRGTPNSPGGKEHKYILMVDMHHIISDGSSMGVFIKDLMTLYRGEALPILHIRYRDYSEWHNRAKAGGSINRQETYWLNRLAGEIPVLNLPLDYARPLLQSFEGKTLHFEIREECTALLKSLALKKEVTLFMLLLAIIDVWLAKLSGQEEIIVGMPAAARRHADLQEIIGMFVNTLVLWNQPAGNKPFDIFLKEVKEKTLNAFENQEYPFEDLVEKVSAPRDAGRNPLFDVIFALQNMETNEIEIPGLTLKPYDYENKTAKFDLTIIGIELENKLLFTVEYCTKLFKEKTISKFITYFKHLVSSISDDQQKEISAISFIPAEEKQQLLYEFNDTQSREPTDKTLHELFAGLAGKIPDHIALIGPHESRFEGTGGLAPLSLLMFITYKELNENANQLAYSLKEKGVKPDTIVAIMMERSIEMIIGIFGILKAGGAYLPIELNYPEDRVNYMFKDAKVNILVKNDNIFRDFASPGDIRVISIDDISNKIHPKDALSHLRLQPAPVTSLAYIIYTSGTTGKPKGNLTTHANVIRVVKNTNYCEITPGDRILQLSNYAFDGSVFDIYGALLNGAGLVLPDRDTVLAVDLLAAAIIRQQITVFFVTTALFNTLIDMQIDCFAHVRKVLFGGERVSSEHAGKALEYLGQGRVIHVYGPTETTVYATYYFIEGIAEDAATIPIGMPITDTTTYILDKYLHLVPIGVTGELYIGGKGLARGYLNQPELTSDKFLPIFNRSYSSNMSYISTKKIYKTGDLVRRLADGNIEFIGRIDGQIKIRGFRVELGEIEKRLLDHGQIQEAVVTAVEPGKGDKQLAAYLVPRTVGAGLSPGLREYLSGFLPAYMIPSYFVELEKLPLTPNGKVDQKLLPGPGTFKTYPGESYAAPATDMEKLIADTWKEMLKIEKVGIDDNFFDIGGNSLNILQVNKKLNMVLESSLPVMVMFRYTTIRSLAGFLGERDTKNSLDRKQRSEALAQGKSDRMKRYQKREQRTRKVDLKERRR